MNQSNHGQSPRPVVACAAYSPAPRAHLPSLRIAALRPALRIVAALVSFSAFSAMPAFFGLRLITLDNTSYQGFPCSN